jgi:hypothetical protein
VKERKPPAVRVLPTPFKKGGIACHGLTSKKGGIKGKVEFSIRKLRL